MKSYRSLFPFIACLGLLGGCATRRKDVEVVPRTQILSPRATSSISREFENARLEKLVVIIDGSPITKPIPAPGGYTWQGSLAAGGWVPDSQLANQNSAPFRFVEDEITAVLLQKGYTVPNRSDLRAALAELKLFENTGLTDEDSNRVGKLLKASAILIISAIGGAENFTFKGQAYARLNFRISARLIRIGQSDILWMANKTYSGDVRKGSVDLDWIGGFFREIAELLPDNDSR